MEGLSGERRRANQRDPLANLETGQQGSRSRGRHSAAGIGGTRDPNAPGDAEHFVRGIVTREGPRAMLARGLGGGSEQSLARRVHGYNRIANEIGERILPN